MYGHRLPEKVLGVEPRGTEGVRRAFFLFLSEGRQVLDSFMLRTVRRQSF